ncbi:MAG: ribonuclease J [Alphaproteobacteria bacterium]|nr:ribonuclease J [Alphaproteobacteria bacterium]
MQPKKDDLLIAPLGGMEQIGANCTMVGNNKEWLMIDLGIAFYDKLGIEVLTPDISFPVEERKNLRGIFITHAHEDHLGAIPYLWTELRCPIYLTEFPAAVLRQKLKEYDWGDEVSLNVVKPGEVLDIGGFKVEFVSLAHSVLGSCGIFIKTQAGNIFHTGDWKIDETPLLGDTVDEKRLKEIGEEGVDCLLCDSTNMLAEAQIGSEAAVREALERVVAQYKDKRITVTCFASNVARMETIFAVAKKLGRKVAVIGRSMHKMMAAVEETSYFTSKFKESIAQTIAEDEAMDMPPEKVLFLCTGSQGEPRSALSKLARDDNKTVSLGEKDVVVFSSKVIPGNELEIRDVQNMLIRRGVEIVTTETEDDIHVSGHPDKKAVAQMYKWLKPRSLMPVHGDARMLYTQRDFARKCGISEVCIAESGDFVNFSGGRLEKVDHRDVVFDAVDGVDLIPLNSPELRQRSTMSYNGHVSVSFLLSGKKMLGSPEISIEGIYIPAEENGNITSKIRQIISSEITKHSKNASAIKKDCDAAIKSLFSRNFEKKPLVVVHILKQ